MIPVTGTHPGSLDVEGQAGQPRSSESILKSHFLVGFLHFFVYFVYFVFKILP